MCLASTGWFAEDALSPIKRNTVEEEEEEEQEEKEEEEQEDAAKSEKEDEVLATQPLPHRFPQLRSKEYLESPESLSANPGSPEEALATLVGFQAGAPQLQTRSLDICQLEVQVVCQSKVPLSTEPCSPEKDRQRGEESKASEGLTTPLNLRTSLRTPLRSP